MYRYKSMDMHSCGVPEPMKRLSAVLSFLIGLSKYWGVHSIRALYLSAMLTYSRRQLPRSYDHLSLPSTSAPQLHPCLLSHYPRFNALDPPIVRLVASSGNTAHGTGLSWYSAAVLRHVERHTW